MRPPQETMLFPLQFKRAPGLLGMRNHNAEKALFRSARHLIGEKDGDRNTGLQLLSCNPSAFKQEPEDGFVKFRCGEKEEVEHVDDEGRNVLHVEIKYRELKIFKLVTRMEVPMKRLVRKLDNDGNSILHTIRRKIKDFVPDEKMKGPAFLSQEDVENFTPSHFLNHDSTDKLTAEWFLVAANSELLDLTREWQKITAEGRSVVAVLIATVSLPAACTAPGGSNQSTGVPVLNKPLFVWFSL
ncbi:hypothetical protein SADUNF_Sadunf04G0002300 [Salix dunnii]|uniref:PGG domain-containing protein n=1 Tax=Salix dunnii TaxID=1413687 RepID=A0A835MZX7_9ROSI|nr:hypothetical protein SADUNF_Sadunf04G0002300 [Salix dunnii]